MSTQSQQFALAQNGNFQQRCVAAATSQAVAVYAEAPATTNHTNRVALAFQVIFYPATWAPRFALAAVMGNANLQTAAPNDATAQDSDITTAVTGVWNGLADGLANLQTAKVI